MTKKYPYELERPDFPSVGHVALEGGRMYHGRYIGAIPALKGKTALLMKGAEKSMWLCQFDDLDLPVGYTHGWHPHPMYDIELLGDRDGNEKSS